MSRIGRTFQELLLERETYIDTSKLTSYKNV